MVKMRKDSLLRVLLVMIVLAHFNSAFDWRWLKRPSEVFRQRSSVLRHVCDDDDDDAAAHNDARSQETMTFHEFKKYRDKLRNELWTEKLFPNPEVKNGGHDDGTKKTEEESRSNAKQELWASEGILWPKNTDESTASFDTPNENFVSKLEQRISYSNDDPEKANRVTLEKSTAAESGDRQLKGTQLPSLRSGNDQEDSLPSPNSPQGVAAGETTSSENSAKSINKTCAACSPVWYHVLTAIIPVAWLTNIVLVAWIFYGRETKQTMRISRGLVHKSSQTHQRSQLLPPYTATHEKDKRPHGNNPASVRTPQSRLRNSSPAQSVSSVNISRRRSVESLSRSPEVYQKKNVPETRKSKTMAHDRSNGDHAQAAGASCLRPHIGGRLVRGQEENGLAHVTERSTEDRDCQQEYSDYNREAQMGHANGELKLWEGENDQSLKNRRKRPTVGHKTDPSADRKSPSIEANLGPTAWGRTEEPICNLGLPDENVYIKPQIMKETQSETGKGTFREPVGSGKEKMAKGDFVNASVGHDSESLFFDAATKETSYFDVATQMSSIYISKSPTGDPHSKLKSGTVKTPDLTERNAAPEFVDRTTSPVIDAINRNPKANGEMPFCEQFEISNIQSCEYESVSDHCRRQGGGHDTFYTWHPHGNTRGSCRGGTGIMNGDVYNAGRYDKSPYEEPESKGDDERSYQADSLIFEAESLVPPPPYGYHVRRHFSNPDSSTNVCRIMQFDSVGNELGNMGLLNSNDLFASRKNVSAFETENTTSSSSEVWHSLVNSQPPLTADVPSGREHPVARKIDNEKKKRPRNLMIIGKVNSGQRHKIKPAAKTQLGVTSGCEFDVFSKSNAANRERKQDTARTVQAFPVVVKGQRKTPELGGRYIEHVSPQTIKRYPIAGCVKSLVGGSKQNYNILEYADKHVSHARRNARHPSTLKINGGINIKRANLKRAFGDGRKSANRLKKHSQSQSCMNVALERIQNSPDHRHRFHSRKEKFELLPSYFMNLNCNAGISDPNAENVAGIKSQLETSSVENTQSTDQFFSTHGDSEVQETSSDVDSNLSPSFTHDGDDVITVISLGKYEPSLAASVSNDKLKPGGFGPVAEAQQKAHTFNDSDMGHKSGQEKANSEKGVDLRGENTSNRSTASLITRDPHINAIYGGRHKRKAKTTETGVLKQENSISKKTSATSGSKEWRKLVLSKSKPENPKEQLTAGDVHKGISGAIEKCNKHAGEAQRLGKIGKGSEAHSEGFETKMKAKSGYESYLDYIGYKESTHRGRVLSNTQGQGVRSAESDHRYSLLGTGPSTSSKSEDVSQIKRLVSLPETMPSQGSPKKTSLPTQYQMKPDVADTKSSVEVKSQKVVSAGASSTTPLCSKQGSTPSSSIKPDVITKLDAIKRNDSPKRDLLGSPKKEKSVSPNKEVINVPETNKAIEQTSMEKRSMSDNTRQTEAFRLNPETKLMLGSPNCATSIDVQKDNLSRTRDSPIRKVGDTAHKYRNAKTPTENAKCKTVECATAKDNHRDSSNGKLGAHTNLRSKKKSASYFKTHSRSPDGKRKRRNLKRIITEVEDIKMEKPKNVKSVDKLTDKKRKKKKFKLKTADDLEEVTQSVGAAEHLVYKSSSRSRECSQVTETSLCSCPTEKALDAAASEPGLSAFLQSKKVKEIRSASSTGRMVSSGYVIQGFGKQCVLKYDEAKIKEHVSSSAETTSSMSGLNMPVLSAESLLPFPTTPAKTSSKAIQLVPCPKVRKNEKDLQEAELGWNSTFSTDDKAATDKIKQNQKRAMVRYYIVKPKLQKTDREVGVSKLKRPAPRVNHGDAEAVRSSSEIDLNSQVVQPERAKPGPGKSVQFSDNIEDLEASKEDTAIERPLRRPDSDSILHHAITKAAIETIKITGKALEPEIAATVKTIPLKKEEQRSPVNPVRKRRPVWLKKSGKDKAAAAVKPSEAAKSAAMCVPVKKLHSSDNILKASSRLNLHFYYPLKATVGSPKLSNTSLTDKRKVTYKAWINSIFMAAPMNKATKKLVAKAGSPVDIKEIIEGSSVDAADHFKISKPLHDGDVRSARSVPSLAPTKTAGVDLIGGKKQKSSDDSRLLSHKKSKDKHRECWSPRSHSAAEPKEHQIRAIKGCLGAVDGPTSPLSSSNVDIVAALKQKNGMVRAGDHANRRRKDKKGGKKVLGENNAKWQGLASHEGRNVSDMERIHYCGDMMELNVLNMGLSWMVQSVFNRLPFLSQRQQSSTPISTRNQATDQQLVE